MFEFRLHYRPLSDLSETNYNAWEAINCRMDTVVGHVLKFDF